MKTEFTTVVFHRDGQKVVAASFTREAGPRSSRAMELRVLPDKSVEMYVGRARVQSFEAGGDDEREARALIEDVQAVGKDAVRMLGFRHGSPEYRSAWWKIRNALESRAFSASA